MQGEGRGQRGEVDVNRRPAEAVREWTEVRSFGGKMQDQSQRQAGVGGQDLPSLQQHRKMDRILKSSMSQKK